MRFGKSKNSRLFSFAAALGFFAGAIFLTVDDGVCGDGTISTIIIKDAVWVKGEKVYVKDVTDIDDSVSMAEGLGEIYLAYAPAPGREKKLHGEWIKSKIRSKPWVPANTPIQVAEFIRVGRRSQRVDDKTFLELYRNHIAERLHDRNADFQVRRFKVVGNRPFPEGELEIKLANPGAEEYMGNVNLSAVVYVDGTTERRVNLSGWVDRFEEVVCSKQALSRHSVISEGDLCLRRKNISKLSSRVIKERRLAVGKRCKHSIDAGGVLTLNSVEDVPVIQRGDRVTIVAESDALRITALGIAEDRGGVGDRIRVTNCMGEKEIVAGIVDSSTVKIEF